jgi:hypothetical protein
VTAGIVSAINRDISESPFDDYVQTDAVKLPRFRGHRNVCVQGVRDGQDKATLCA